MTNKKVLVVTYIHPLLTDFLESKGFIIDDKLGISVDEFSAVLSMYDGVVLSTKYMLNKENLSRAKSLKWIGRIGSGMENIDTEYAHQKGIHFFSTPEGNAQSVAEHALALFLSLLRNLPKSFDEIKQGQWVRKENTAHELSASTVGIIGYGNTGKAFARLLKNIGVKVLAYDKYKSGFSERGITESTLEQVCSLSNLISMHLPLTEETQNYCDEVFFAKLKCKPFFINTSRGKIALTKHIVNALERKQISAVGLDVLDNEDLSSYTQDEKKILQKLMSFPNVVLTSHFAGYSFEAEKKMSLLLIEKLKIIANL